MIGDDSPDDMIRGKTRKKDVNLKSPQTLTYSTNIRDNLRGAICRNI